MKLHFSLLSVPVLLTLSIAPVLATEVVVVDWNHTWDYMQPMGLDPAVADTDFNTTWFQKPADFAVNYNGPAFGGITVPGNPAVTSSINSGSGPGPLGYETINYFASAGAVVTGFGRTLTIPNSGNRYSAYFRTTFTTGATYAAPRIRMVLDDGALIYLDGVLVARVNKADNTEGYTQLGADTTATLNETGGSLGDEECVQTFPLATAGAGTQADSFVIVPVSFLAPGEHTLAVSARSNATNSSDLCMALQLLGDDTGISAEASNVQRQPNGPGFADDTFTFDVTVTPNNLPSAVSWFSDNSAANGPTSGSYAPAVYSYTFPAQLDSGTVNRVTIVFNDGVDTVRVTSLSVTAPEGPDGPPLVISAATPSFGTGFEEAGMGLGNFSRRDFNTELSFTSNGVVITDVPANASGSKMLRFSAVNALMTTEAVRLDPSVRSVKAGVSLRTYTDSDTGFEFDDSLRIHVEGSSDGLVWADRGSLVPALYGDGPSPVVNPAAMDQILVKLGPGTPGVPLSTSLLAWAAPGDGFGPSSETLTIPAFTVPDAQPVQMEFTHRYSFEYDVGATRWDGGAVAVAINGGAFTPIPGSAFSQQGYDGIVTGNHVLLNMEAFNGDSPNYSTGAMVTSILTIPGLSSGDSCEVQFLGAWDEFAAGSNPNWEIKNVNLTSGATVLFSKDFTAGDGGLVGTAGWFYNNPGPAYHTFTRFALPVASGDQFVRLRLYQPSNVALSNTEFILIDHIKLEAGLDPLADADGDGVTNGMEDLAGTSLTDPQSSFNVSSVVGPSPVVPGNQRATLTFPAPDFRTYRFQSSDDLLTWADVEVRYGDPAVPSLTLTSEASTPEKFWRIAISY